MIKPTALRRAFEEAKLDPEKFGAGSFESCPLRHLADHLGFDKNVYSHVSLMSDVNTSLADDITYFLCEKNILDYYSSRNFTSTWDCSTSPKPKRLDEALSRYELACISY